MLTYRLVVIEFMQILLIERDYVYKYTIETISNVCNIFFF